jgi:hypothetical protein
MNDFRSRRLMLAASGFFACGSVEKDFLYRSFRGFAAKRTIYQQQNWLWVCGIAAGENSLCGWSTNP